MSTKVNYLKLFRFSENMEMGKYKIQMDEMGF